MTKIKVWGYLDTECRTLVIEGSREPARRGRRADSPGKTAARVLADAWATSNFTAAKSRKNERIRGALAGAKVPGDDGSMGRAIRTAKARENSLFRSPHKPGEIYYGRVVAIWFSDRATRYEGLATIEIVGLAWVWTPGLPEAIFRMAKAELPK